MLAPFSAVIFDCDGVLVDSEPLGLRSLQLALRENGVERSLSFLSRFSGRGHQETLAALEAESGVRLLAEKVSSRMDDRYVDLVRGEGLKRCDGVHELLSWLMSRRIPFTLASSGPRRKVIFSLESADIAWAFPDFVCGDDVMRTKPAPDLYLSAASILRVPPVNCLAIEDAPAGVQAALSAGMQVVAVTTSFDEKTLLGASLVIKSLRLLLEQWTTSEALTSPCSPDTF